LVIAKLVLEEWALVWKRAGLSCCNVLGDSPGDFLYCLCLEPAERGLLTPPPRLLVSAPAWLGIPRAGRSCCFLLSMLSLIFIFFLLLLCILAVFTAEKGQERRRCDCVSCSCLAESSLCSFVGSFLLQMGPMIFSSLDGISKCLGSRNKKCYIGSAATAHPSKLQIQMK